MQKMYLLTGFLCLALSGMAQTDSTTATRDTSIAPQSDTIRIGNMIIIKSGNGADTRSDTSIVIRHRKFGNNANLSTNWGIFDLGFANFNDNTNYSSAATQQFAPGSNSSWFGLKNGKSVNVNVWIFMQRLNLVSHVLNLKYGVGLELNNYRFDDDIRFSKNPRGVYKAVPAISYSKNKLAADYVTVPLMLNVNLTPNKDKNHSFGFSGGISAGYLYSSRQKFISGPTGKQKLKGDLGMEPFKISYVGEVQLGPIKLYGSMATKSMFKNGLDFTPYNFGLRFSNW